MGLFAFLIALKIVSDVAGFWGMVVGFVFFPVTFTVAPLYAGLRLHEWMPTVFTYGGAFAAYVGFAFGGLLAQGGEFAESREESTET